MSEELLSVKNLHVEYHTGGSVAHAVNGVSFDVMRGETLGIVGETGAGKTTTALAILKLLPKISGFVTEGSVTFSGQDITSFNDADMRLIRGERISMIFQDPMTSLNPVMTVGEQIQEMVQAHSHLDKQKAGKKVDEILTLVGILPQRKNEYPHQFSGGMKQRVVIAIALACEPELVIADEPTTALDVTIQAQILKMISDLKKKNNMSMILITHDLGVVAEMCNKVAIMYAGEIIESGTLEDIYDSEKRHPYTEGLFDAIPDLINDLPRLKPIAGLMPDPMNLPSGCKFHPRCPYCMDICRQNAPDYVSEGTHTIKCHLFDKEDLHG